MASLMLFPVATFASQSGIVELCWNAVRDATPGSAIPVLKELPALAFCVVMPVLLNVVSLFLYRRRRLQMRLVGVSAGVELGVCAMLVYVSFQVSGAMGSTMHFHLRWLLPVAAAVLDFLAYRRIRYDDMLLRSLERLR